MRYKSFFFKRAAGFVVFGLAIAALLSWVVMSLWNCVLVPVLAVKIITFWQALGILILSKILFGGFHGKPHRPHSWGQRMKEKLEGMNAEERELFKQQWRNRCSRWGRFQDHPTNEV